LDEQAAKIRDHREHGCADKTQESAVIATLEPGAYTATVEGAGGGSGIGLVEVFDLEQ
jgi:hypothetical protein